MKEKEGQDTIDGEGNFQLNLQTEFIQPVFLKIDNVTAQLYVEPDMVYGITVPELDEDRNVNRDVELPVNIGIVGADSTELNALIFDYQNLYNEMFTVNDGKYLSRPLLFKRADSLHKICNKRYAGVKNDYFQNYVFYSIASFNSSISRGEKFLMHSFIINKPLLYNHYEYMQFFNSCTNGYLSRIASERKGQSLYNIINNQADYNTLLNFVRLDKDLRSDTLRELIILRNLWDFYFKADFGPQAITAIVSQFHHQSKIKAHLKISSAMLSYFNKLQVGSPSPGFLAMSKDNRILDFSSYKGRWIYLNFFSTKNIESLKQMPKIAALQKKFGAKMVFISICLDDSLSDYRKYVQSNPKFTWPILYNYHKSISRTAKDAYFVTGTEGYFLINNTGYLAQSPAKAPSQGIEYKLNVIFKVKERNTKTGIR